MVGVAALEVALAAVPVAALEVAPEEALAAAPEEVLVVELVG